MGHPSTRPVDEIRSSRSGQVEHGAEGQNKNSMRYAPCSEHSEVQLTTDHGQLTPCEIGTINAFKGIGGVLNINRVE
jgi:hypothetical protein